MLAVTVCVIDQDPVTELLSKSILEWVEAYNSSHLACKTGICDNAPWVISVASFAVHRIRSCIILENEV